MGLPTFRLSSWASSSECSLMSAASLARERPRLPAAHVAQPLRSSNAFCAAATARSTSSRPPSGAVAMTLPVAGSTTSNVCPSAASTVSPPITICRACASCRVSVVMVALRSVVRDRCARWWGRRLRRDDGGADDPRVVAELGSNDGTAHGQLRDELVGVLADAAAEDHQVRPHQLLDPVEMLVEVDRPGLPGQSALHSGTRGRPLLRGPTPDLHLAELGVRDEDPVVEDTRPDTRAEGQEDDDALLAGADPEAHLGDARRIGIVDDRDRSLQE